MKLKLVKIDNKGIKSEGLRLKKEIKQDNIYYYRYIDYITKKEILYTKKELYIDDINNQLLNLRNEYLYCNNFIMNNFGI